MAVLMSQYTRVTPSLKRRRRNATAVLAGEFDPRPQRYVLTSLLNGVPANHQVESEEKTKRDKKREKRERDRERKRQKAAVVREMKERDVTYGEPSTSSAPMPIANAPTKTSISAPVAQIIPTASSFWRARPAIHIASMQRSVSVTPPPLPSSPVSTPGPSLSSSTSRTSSKRPYTPDDDEEDQLDEESYRLPQKPKEPPKKRVAAKKGWKGWVEGSPPPSEKLINLDYAPILRERKTRSGKAFDGVGQGADWV